MTTSTPPHAPSELPPTAFDAAVRSARAVFDDAVAHLTVRWPGATVSVSPSGLAQTDSTYAALVTVTLPDGRKARMHDPSGGWTYSERQLADEAEDDLDILDEVANTADDLIAVTMRQAAEQAAATASAPTTSREHDRADGWPQPASRRARTSAIGAVAHVAGISRVKAANVVDRGDLRHVDDDKLHTVKALVGHYARFDRPAPMPLVVDLLADGTVITGAWGRDDTDAAGFMLAGGRDGLTLGWSKVYLHDEEHIHDTGVDDECPDPLRVARAIRRVWASSD